LLAESDMDNVPVNFATAVGEKVIATAHFAPGFKVAGQLLLAANGGLVLAP